MENSRPADAARRFSGFMISAEKGIFHSPDPIWEKAIGQVKGTGYLRQACTEPVQNREGAAQAVFGE
ncbi:MAG: hypothetical protein ISN29_12150 [Gammaproteobacteria bacterium AqS3]|nr:hypothetical protein [Gammaproteobacteria bacterium AqS3]